jgi:NitT/TauT family transport system substrate-binding protein
MLSRRAAIIATLAASAARPARAAAPVRIGVLQSGTLQWVIETIRAGKLDDAAGIALAPVMLANTDAGRVGLLAGGLDIALLDWPFVAAQRNAGNNLVFAPFSNAVGGVVVPGASRIAALSDLAGARLGVAGGPADKSWLILRAAAMKAGVDLTAAAQVQYGAPPLLGAKLQQGELDAVLTYWNFAATLEGEGCREAISIDTCTQALGLSLPPGLVGFAFPEDWARQNPEQAAGFLRAVRAAESVLQASDTAWNAIRPLMNAQSDAVFASLRRRFLAGLPRAPVSQLEATAGQLVRILAENGGAQAMGGLTSLPAGTFWQGPDGKA